MNYYLILVDFILGVEPVVDLVILNTAPSSVPGSQTGLILEYRLKGKSGQFHRPAQHFGRVTLFQETCVSYFAKIWSEIRVLIKIDEYSGFPG